MNLKEAIACAPELPGLYVITNTLNGKSYVGRAVNLVRRLREHARMAGTKTKPLYKAFEKYGIEAFSVTFSVHETLEDLPRLEVEYIGKFSAKVPNGYNLTDGGESNLGWNPGVETRKRMSEWQIGRKLSESHKVAIGLATSRIHTGMKRSEEACRNIGKAKLGFKHSEETKAKLSAMHKGLKRSEEFKAAASERVSGSRNPMYGKQPGNSKPVYLYLQGALYPLEFKSVNKAAIYLGVGVPVLLQQIKGCERPITKHMYRKTYTIAYQE